MHTYVRHPIFCYLTQSMLVALYGVSRQHVGPIFKGQAVIIFCSLLRLKIPGQLRLEKFIWIMEIRTSYPDVQNFSKNLEVTSKF
jgi:hypothetical protein